MQRLIWTGCALFLCIPTWNCAKNFYTFRSLVHTFLQVFEIQICVCACGWVSKSEFLFDWVSVTSLLGRHSTGHVRWLVSAKFWQLGATWCCYDSVSIQRSKKKTHKAFQPCTLHEDLLGKTHRITTFKLVIFLSWSNHTPLLDFESSCGKYPSFFCVLRFSASGWWN